MTSMQSSVTSMQSSVTSMQSSVTSKQVEYHCKDFDPFEKTFVDEGRAAVRSALSNMSSKASCSNSDEWKSWHSMHLKTNGKFFKEKRYLIEEFKKFSILSKSTTTILDIGCGTGSSSIPFMRAFSSTPVTFLCCDFAASAIDKLAQNVSKSIPHANLTVKGFVTDFSDPLFQSKSLSKAMQLWPKDTSTVNNTGNQRVDNTGKQRVDNTGNQTVDNMGNQTVDNTGKQQVLDNTDTSICQPVLNKDGTVSSQKPIMLALMIFMLSAVHPDEHVHVVKNLYNTVAKGAKVFFRDYALYDLPMLRFCRRDEPPLVLTPFTMKAISSYELSKNTGEDEIGPHLCFRRGDGTKACFFSQASLKTLFEKAGFVLEEMEYCTVINKNRKLKKEMKRIWIHAVFVKK